MFHSRLFIPRKFRTHTEPSDSKSKKQGRPFKPEESFIGIYQIKAGCIVALSFSGSQLFSP